MFRACVTKYSRWRTFIYYIWCDVEFNGYKLTNTISAAAVYPGTDRHQNGRVGEDCKLSLSKWPAYDATYRNYFDIWSWRSTGWAKTHRGPYLGELALHSLMFRFLPSSLPYFPSLSYLFPLIQLRSLGSAVSSPSGFSRSPADKRVFGKVWQIFSQKWSIW